MLTDAEKVLDEIQSQTVNNWGRVLPAARWSAIPASQSNPPRAQDAGDEGRGHRVGPGVFREDKRTRVALSAALSALSRPLPGLALSLTLSTRHHKLPELIGTLKKKKKEGSVTARVALAQPRGGDSSKGTGRWVAMPGAVVTSPSVPVRVAVRRPSHRVHE